MIRVQIWQAFNITTTLYIWKFINLNNWRIRENGRGIQVNKVRDSHRKVIDPKDIRFIQSEVKKEVTIIME